MRAHRKAPARQGDRDAERVAAAGRRHEVDAVGLAPQLELEPPAEGDVEPRRLHGDHHGGRPAGEIGGLGVIGHVARIRWGPPDDPLFQPDRFGMVLVIVHMPPEGLVPKALVERDGRGVVGPDLEPHEQVAAAARLVLGRGQQLFPDTAAARVLGNRDRIEPGDRGGAAEAHDGIAGEPSGIVLRHQHRRRRRFQVVAQAARRQPVAGESARLERLDRFHVVRSRAAGGHHDVRLIHGQLRKALKGIRLASGRRLTSCTARR